MSYFLDCGCRPRLLPYEELIMEKLEKEMLELVEEHTQKILKENFDPKIHLKLRGILQKAILRGVSIGMLWERREQNGR